MATSPSFGGGARGKSIATVEIESFAEYRGRVDPDSPSTPDFPEDLAGRVERRTGG